MKDISNIVPEAQAIVENECGAFTKLYGYWFVCGQRYCPFLNIIPPVKGCDVSTPDAVQHLGNFIGDKNSEFNKHQAMRDIIRERSLKMEYITFDKIELKHQCRLYEIDGLHGNIGCHI
jgi:hypothetical protein